MVTTNMDPLLVLLQVLSMFAEYRYVKRTRRIYLFLSSQMSEVLGSEPKQLLETLMLLPAMPLNVSCRT